METIEGMIGDIKIEDLLSEVKAAINALARAPDVLNGKLSGYLSARCRRTNQVLLLVEIGQCPPDKVGKYRAYCLEKGDRLFSNIHHHISSWQSRNELEKKFGGAIAAGDFILSFSGLPELADEAVMIVAAQRFELTSDEEATEIATISNNKIYWKLAEIVF